MTSAGALVVGQAMIEHGMLDSLGAAAFSARSTIERSINEEPSLWVAGIAVVLVLAFLLRRR